MVLMIRTGQIMNKREKVLQVVFDSVEEINQQLPHDHQLEKSENALLFGKSGQLDSLGLVTFIVAVEENLQRSLGITITLADERAMSQQHSPFRSIGTLVSYINDLLDESSHA
jgi:D-alanine--poly(phosphoribitol) ligase subunit 2